MDDDGTPSVYTDGENTLSDHTIRQFFNSQAFSHVMNSEMDDQDQIAREYHSDKETGTAEAKSSRGSTDKIDS